MNTFEKQAILTMWTDLVRSVDVRNVIDALIQHAVLSLEESEIIRIGDTKSEQARRMLGTVMKSMKPEVFDIFMFALEENYPFIVENIAKKVTALKRERFKKKDHPECVEEEYDIITNGMEDPFGAVDLRPIENHRAVEREESTTSSSSNESTSIPISNGAHGVERIRPEPSENASTTEKKLANQPAYNVSFEPSSTTSGPLRSQSLPIKIKAEALNLSKILHTISERCVATTIPKEQFLSYDTVDMPEGAHASEDSGPDPPSPDPLEGPPTLCRHVVLINPKHPTKDPDFGFVLAPKPSGKFCQVEAVTQGDIASRWLEAGDLILSVNGESMKGKKRDKVMKAILKTERQLTMEVESLGYVCEHRIGLTLSRADEENWGFTMITGKKRPRFSGDVEFYCTGVVADTPVGRSGLLKVGDTLTGCEGAIGSEVKSFSNMTQPQIDELIRGWVKFTLHIFRREFIRSGNNLSKSQT